MPELEEQLRRYADGIESLVADVSVPAARSRAHRWQVWTAVAAIAAVVAVVTTAVGLSSDDRDRLATGGEDPIDAPAWEWRAIAEGPLEASSGAVSVWTGEEMLVFGGSRTVVTAGDGADGAMSDGAPIRTDTSAGAAAYDPEADSWRLLASPPVDIGGGAAMWTGNRVLVAAPSDVVATSILVYDLEHDSWSDHPLPLPAGSFGLWDPAIAWTGDELLIWAYQHRRHDQPGFLFGFDPDVGSFEEYDVGPLDYRWGVTGHSASNGLTVVGGSGNVTSLEGPALDVASFDVETQVWSDFEPGPLPDLSDPWVVDVDGELVVFGGWAWAPNDQAAALSPSTGRWRVVATEGLPGTSAASGVAAWTGEEIVVLDSPPPGLSEAPGSASGALDPATGEWRPLPDPPGGVACGSTGVWTGNEFIVWGGSIGCTPTLTPRHSGFRMSVG